MHIQISDRVGRGFALEQSGPGDAAAVVVLSCGAQRPSVAAALAEALELGGRQTLQLHWAGDHTPEQRAGELHTLLLTLPAAPAVVSFGDAATTAVQTLGASGRQAVSGLTLVDAPGGTDSIERELALRALAGGGLPVQRLSRQPQSWSPTSEGSIESVRLADWPVPIHDDDDDHDATIDERLTLAVFEFLERRAPRTRRDERSAHRLLGAEHAPVAMLPLGDSTADEDSAELLPARWCAHDSAQPRLEVRMRANGPAARRLRERGEFALRLLPAAGSRQPDCQLALHREASLEYGDEFVVIGSVIVHA